MSDAGAKGIDIDDFCLHTALTNLSKIDYFSAKFIKFLKENLPQKNMG